MLKKVMQLGVLVGVALFGVVAPAQAFTLFGITLWGREEPERIEVIDPQTYRLDFRVEGDEALADRAREASALWQGRGDAAAGSAGLIARARNDYALILGAMYRAGYYGPKIEIRIAGQEVSGLSLFADFAEKVPVSVQVIAGPRFHFGQLDVQNPAVSGAEVNFAPGLIARSTAVEKMVDSTISGWRDQGFAVASLAQQDVIADHRSQLLDVTLAFNPGPKVFFGLTATEGSRSVDADFIRYMADVPAGKVFDPKVLADAQARLARLEVFSSVRVLEGDLVNGNQMPVTIALQDRLPRRFGFGAAYSNVDGLALEGYWLHRNLFGRAEQLRFDASIAGIAGLQNYERYDYTLEVSFLKPGVFTPDTDFRISSELHHLNLPAFEDDSFEISFALAQIFNDRLSGLASIDLERSRFTSASGVDEVTIAGFSGGLSWDNRNDTLNATRGYFLTGSAAPYWVLDGEGDGTVLNIEGRAYWDLDEDAKWVLAGRVRFGSLVGTTSEEAPIDRLFFAGGGGSIRGYAYQSVGVDVVGGDPVGGASLVEASVELRAQITSKIGVVGFIDAGLVGPDAWPNGGERFLAGAGIGARYFTGLGPLRVDLAVPLDDGVGGSDFALYIGIGQAF